MSAAILLSRLVESEEYSDFEVIQLLNGAYDIDDSAYAPKAINDLAEELASEAGRYVGPNQYFSLLDTAYGVLAASSSEDLKYSSLYGDEFNEWFYDLIMRAAKKMLSL